jgi:hypothetical protein
MTTMMYTDEDRAESRRLRNETGCSVQEARNRVVAMKARRELDEALAYAHDGDYGSSIKRLVDLVEFLFSRSYPLPEREEGQEGNTMSKSKTIKLSVPPLLTVTACNGMPCTNPSHTHATAPTVADKPAAPPAGEDYREGAKQIQMPFPCGCQQHHSAPNGFTVEEYTCETHLAIASFTENQVKAERERIRSAIKGLRPMNGKFEHNRNSERKSVFDLYYKMLAAINPP